MRIKLSLKNVLILICIAYTILTVVSSSLGLLQGQSTDTHLHIIMRFVVTSLGILSILIFNLFPSWPLAAIYGLHYAVTMGAIFLLIRTSGYFIDLHPNAFRDIFLNFTAVYIPVSLVFMIRNRFKKGK